MTTPPTILRAITLCMDEAETMRAYKTAKTYHNGLDHFSRYLEKSGLPISSPVETLGIDYFIGFIAWLSRRDFSRQTVLVYVAGTKYFLDWLIYNNQISMTYQDTLRYKMACRSAARKRESRLPKTPPRGTVEKMLAAVSFMAAENPQQELVNTRNKAIIEFMASTGCRVAEVSRLKIGDMDLEERKAKVTGKGNKERFVYFSASAAEAMLRYWAIRAFRASNHPAFARHDDGASDRKLHLSTTSMRNVVNNISAMASLDKGSFTPHSFRHAFATRLLRETSNLALVQDALGHASPEATRVYAKVDQEDLKQAHRKVFG